MMFSWDLGESERVQRDAVSTRQEVLILAIVKLIFGVGRSLFFHVCLAELVDAARNGK